MPYVLYVENPAATFANPLASQDVYTNAQTLISALGQGGVSSNVPPSGPPGVPEVNPAVAPTADTINIQWSTLNVTGVPTPNLYAQYSASTLGPYQNVTLSPPYPDGYVVGVASGLTAATPYYFQSVASNSSGVVSSMLGVISTVVAGVPPSGAPTVPAVVGDITISSIYVNFDITGITGTPTPSYYTRYGATLPLTQIWPAPQNPGGSQFCTSQISSLQAATPYYFQSVASNSSGMVSSATSLFSTLTAGSNVGPNQAPTVPSFIPGSATSNALSVTFDAAGVTGTPTPTYSALWGTSVTPTSTLSATLSSGTIYQANLTGLSNATNYYFESVASNATGVSTSVVSAAFSTLAAAPTPTISYVSTILGVGFLTFGTSGFSSILLDTSQNVSVGNWQADGTITYSSTPPGGISGPQYLSTLQGTGNKIVLSLGGASDSPTVLSSMFGLQSGGNFDTGAQNLANSLAYAYFGGPSGANPLGFANTQFDGFTFDGLDLDLEAVTPSTTTLQVFVSTLKANPGFANKIITAAPQTPYLTQGSTSALNANGTFQSFSEMNPASVLNQVYTGNAGNQTSLLSPTSGNLIDYQFIQCYNNAAYSYPTGATNGNWNNVVAAWGIQSLQSGFPGAHPKNIYAFATADGIPLFNNADAIAFNTSLSTANSTIRAFSTSSGVLPYSNVTVADWCAGIGFWAANTVVPGGEISSLPVLSTLYGQPSTLNNMPTKVCMTYGGVFNSAAWGFVGGTNVPVPNARGY